MGPKGVEDVEDIRVAGGESSQSTRRRGRGKAPGKKTRVEQRYGPPRRGKAAENAHMDVEAFEGPESSTPVESWRGDTFFHVGRDQEPRAHFTADKDKEEARRDNWGASRQGDVVDFDVRPRFAVMESRFVARERKSTASPFVTP